MAVLLYYVSLGEARGLAGRRKVMEDMGMTDMQFKNHLRELIANLERILKLGVSEEAEAEIKEVIERYRASLED